MCILEDMQNEELWWEFLEGKVQKHHISKQEEKEIKVFIESKRYVYYYEMIREGRFPADFPHKKIVNKEGTDKKRIVYSFDNEENIVLKFIANELYRFDGIFSRNCYAFRKGYGVKDAIKKFRNNPKYAEKYCFKADISNYFNSIDIDLLIEKLGVIKTQDSGIFELFSKILKEDRVYENGKIINEKHGAMAGTPISPFFANIYLTDMDKYFEEKNIPYFRYSDDILIFADTEKELEERMALFYDKVGENRLLVNNAKVTVAKPYDIWEFLGFSYDNGRIDLSENTMRKIKAKIKRKAEALRRWQRKKCVTSDKAAIGFIRAMNMKFYGESREKEDMGAEDVEQSDEFTWCRWFFPNITEDKSLKEIDSYMQEYVRYVVTGRHYKGNYRIGYEQIKQWGYRSLVHEYYKGKMQRE